MIDYFIEYFYAIEYFIILLFLENYFLNKEASHIISKHIGSVLKFERMRQQITIAAIADAVEVNASTIVSVEEAKHQASFVLIYGMLQYLKINPSEFFILLERNKSSS